MIEFNRREFLRTGLALSAASRVASATDARAASPKSLNSPTLAMQTLVTGPRERLLFDFGWEFHLGDTTALHNLGAGDGLGAFSKTGTFKFAMESFDASNWKTLDLPHDWAIELPFVNDPALENHGFKPLGRDYRNTSISWYRRIFVVPAADLGRRLVLEFEGVFRSAMVFLNGCYVGRNDSGYVPFEFDVTDFLNYGSDNVIMVRVDATYGDGWFYEGAGIYRHVWLTKTDRMHLGHYDSVVRSEVKHGHAILMLETRIENESGESRKARAHWSIIDAEGGQIAHAVTDERILRPGESQPFDAQTTLNSPALWSPDSPHLYTAVVTVEGDGQIIDVEQFRFGVRTVEFSADRGLLLNGRSVKIKGTCNHQDHAGVGTGVPDRLQEYRVNVLRSMGCNSVRTSHNMPAPAWVSACDRLGMMMMCETRTMSTSPDGLSELETMIKRYRNSPCVILWSMGNEEWVLQNGPMGERIVAAMIARSHELDPTRLCTAAVNGVYDKGVALALDVLGFNYNLDAIDPYHVAHPRRRLVGSETASAICTRGIYSTDPLRNWVSAYDVNHTNWSELAEQWWQFYAARDFLPGGFAWTGFDYRGEPTPYGWPSVSSQFGIVDTCGFPKDSFYYYRASWGTEPVLHLFPHWNWEGRRCEPIKVWVYSNLDEVELFLNGTSLGTKKVPLLGHLEWQVNYEPGTLEARGRGRGRTLIATRETTGEPATIRLTPDHSEIRADGEDVVIVRVEALDHSGRPVPTADVPIQFSINGAGRFRGVGNGDPNCQESDQQPMRSLFNGLAQLIVQAGREPGQIVIEAHSGLYAGPALPRAQLVVTTRKVDPRPAVA